MSCECVQLYLFKTSKHLEIYLWSAWHYEVLKGSLSMILNNLNYLYNSNPNMCFVYEISQSMNMNPYNFPLWLFRDKTTTHIDPHN